MTKAQKELIREAYAKEVDGEGWRKRMERWLANQFRIKILASHFVRANRLKDVRLITKALTAKYPSKYAAIGTNSPMSSAKLKKACRVLVKNQAKTPDYTAWMNQHDMSIAWANRTK